MSDMPRKIEAQQEESGQVPSAVWWIAGGLIGFVLLLVIGAVVLAIFAESVALTVQVIRDVFIISALLALLVALVAIAVLVVQTARYVTLLLHESKPIIAGTQDTVRVLRGTAYFLSKHLTDPVVKAASAFRGVGRAMGHANAIRKNTGGAPFATYVDGSGPNSASATDETSDE